MQKETSNSKKTVEYIKNHPSIKQCLKKGIINYSSLAKIIAEDLDIKNKTSKEAILIAARRYADTLKGEIEHEKTIDSLLSNSEMEIQNKISVFILKKDSGLEKIKRIQNKTLKEPGTFYVLEGSDSYTLISSEKYSKTINEEFKGEILKKKQNLVLINLKSSKNIENVHGVLSHLTSLFAENGVNIIEFLSCWTDTIFVIESKDLNKTLEFLKF